MNINQKKTIALQVIRQKQTITNIAKENQVSRQFVYKQKDKATQAIDDVFKEPDEREKKYYFICQSLKSGSFSWCYVYCSIAAVRSEG